VSRSGDRAYDRAVTLLALQGRFVNRYDLPAKDESLPEDDQVLDLVRRWKRRQ
jgi:hypothetical protein